MRHSVALSFMLWKTRLILPSILHEFWSHRCVGHWSVLPLRCKGMYPLHWESQRNIVPWFLLVSLLLQVLSSLRVFPRRTLGCDSWFFSFRPEIFRFVLRYFSSCMVIPTVVGYYKCALLFLRKVWGFVLRTSGFAPDCTKEGPWVNHVKPVQLCWTHEGCCRSPCTKYLTLFDTLCPWSVCTLWSMCWKYTWRRLAMFLLSSLRSRLDVRFSLELSRWLLSSLVSGTAETISFRI